MRNVFSLGIILSGLLTSTSLLAIKTPTVAATNDTAYKNWSFSSQKVFGIIALSKVKYRAYYKITTVSPELVRVARYNQAGILKLNVEIHFANGVICLIHSINEWGDTVESMALSPLARDQFLVTETTHGVRKDVRVRFERFIYENNLLKELDFLSDSSKLCNNSDGVAIYRYIRYNDPTRFSIENEVSCFDAQGRPAFSRKWRVHRLETNFDQEGNLLTKAGFGIADEEVPDQFGVYKTRCFYDKYGEETLEEYYDIDGKRANNLMGCAKVQCEYKDGFLTKIAGNNVFDLPAVVLMSSNKVSRVEYKYDNRGNMTQIDYYNMQDNRTTNLTGVTEIRYKYSADNMLTDQLNLSTSTLPGQDVMGVFWYQYQRDARGCLLTKTEINAMGLHMRDKTFGGYELRYKYDREGRVISTAAWHDDSTKMLGWHGYHEIVNQYNEIGLLKSKEYLDVNGVPTAGNMGYSREALLCNDYGLLAERKFYAADSAVATLEDKDGYVSGFHAIKYAYNTDYKVLSLEYLDEKEKPVNVSITLDNDMSFNAQRVDFEYLDGKLIKQRFYPEGAGAASVTVDCTKSSYLNTTGMGTRKKTSSMAAAN